jgi:N-methylhydantoinase A/oxoprolinase/acetone carboxylase beta subunit
VCKLHRGPFVSSAALAGLAGTKRVLRVQGGGAVRYRIGSDIGGTFTDLVVCNEETGEVAFGKVLTTPEAPARAVLTGIAELLGRLKVSPPAVRQVLHATTLVGNTVIAGSDERVVLLTTKGFRDVLTLGNEYRYDIYDPNLSFPTPLVRRRDTYEVDERILEDGQVLRPLSAAEVERIINSLKEIDALAAVAICLMHSYANATHERQLADGIRLWLPQVAVAISSDVLPQAGEFERSCATVINARTQPLTSRYLDELRSGLREQGLDADLLIMSSTGGLLGAGVAERYPVRLLESGPTAGALGAAFYGRKSGHPNLLSFDMGGTTAKACLIRDGAPLVVNEFEVARKHTFRRGSGYPVRLPAVDMLEIGAGGGSIASVDVRGLIAVGPESAGSLPGPVCYGRGGSRPTVTDANLLLGYLGPKSFLGDDQRFDERAARAALAELGKKVGMTADEVASGIHEVVSHDMANALRTHAIEKGVDFREFTLIAFGGAGPTHACRVASLLGIRRVVVPVGAGVYSAVGLLTAPLRLDLSQTSRMALKKMDEARVTTIYAELEAELLNLLSEAGAGREDIDVVRTADVRYQGQGVALEVEINVPTSAFRIREAFERAYRAQYGWALENADIEVINWRCRGQGRYPALSLDSTKAALGRLIHSHPGERRVLSHGAFFPCPVYTRRSLSAEEVIVGPALVEDPECTTFVPTGATASLDQAHNIVVELTGGSST